MNVVKAQDKTTNTVTNITVQDPLDLSEDVKKIHAEALNMARQDIANRKEFYDAVPLIVDAARQASAKDTAEMLSRRTL